MVEAVSAWSIAIKIIPVSIKQNGNISSKNILKSMVPRIDC